MSIRLAAGDQKSFGRQEGRAARKWPCIGGFLVAVNCRIRDHRPQLPGCEFRPTHGAYQMPFAVSANVLRRALAQRKTRRFNWKIQAVQER